MVTTHTVVYEPRWAIGSRSGSALLRRRPPDPEARASYSTKLRPLVTRVLGHITRDCSAATGADEFRTMFAPRTLATIPRPLAFGKLRTNRDAELQIITTSAATQNSEASFRLR